MSLLWKCALKDVKKARNDKHVQENMIEPSKYEIVLFEDVGYVAIMSD